MAKQSIRLTNSAVVSALNNKADIELENSSKAAAIESLANSAATTAAAASKVADAAGVKVQGVVLPNLKKENTPREIHAEFMIIATQSRAFPSILYMESWPAFSM